MTGQAAGAFEERGTDTSCRPSPHTSAVRPHIVFWLPFSCALQVAARGSSRVRVERAQVAATRVAGARAGSAAVPLGLAESFEHGAAMALQLCLPDHVGEGAGVPRVVATAAGSWQVSVISWRPALLLMLILALSLLDTQRLYRARKSAVVDAVEAAVPAGAVGGNGLAAVPFRTTSAQEGELGSVAELYCGASC